MFNAVNILEALKNYIRTRGGQSVANNIAEAVNDLNSIPHGSGGDIPDEVTNAIETHGMGWTDEEVKEGFDIQWDGNTEGLESISDVLYLVSSIPAEITSVEDLIGATLGYSLDGSFDSYVLTEDDIDTSDNKVYAIGAAYIVVAFEDGFDEGLGEVKKGIWFVKATEGGYTAYTSRFYKEASTEEVVHQIDEKYVPQSSEVTNAIETGGMGWTEQGEQTVITWGGDTDGRDSFIASIYDLDIPFYKVAEIGDKYAEKALITVFSDDHPEDPTLCYKVSGNGAFIYFGSGFGYVIVADGGEFDVEGFTSIAPSSGVYFLDGVFDDIELRVSSLTFDAPDTIHQIDQKYIPSLSGIIIQTASNAIVGGSSAPWPTVEQVTAAYNAVVSAKPCTLTDKWGEQHFVVNQANVDGDAISISILYYMKKIITYSVENNEVVVTHYEIGRVD